MKFNELSESAKEYAIHTYGEPESWWDEFVIEMWVDRLGSLGFRDPTIHYSGFWSQGNGASFTCDYIDNEAIHSALFYCNDNPEILSEIYSMLNLTDQLADMLGIEGEWEPTLEIKPNSSRYCHENTKYVTVEYNDYFEDISNKFCELVEDFRKSLCHQIYHDLEKEYDYQCSEEHFAETAEINEWEFNEEGELL